MGVEVLDVNAAVEKEDDAGAMTEAEKRAARGDNFVGTEDDDAAAGAAAADDDPAALAAVAGEDDDGAGSKMVPHARFNEVNTRLQEEREARIRAEERARVLEEQRVGKPAAAATEERLAPRDTRKKIQELFMTGEEDAALDLQEKLDQQLKDDARAEAVAAMEARQAKEAIETVASAMIEKYPFLNSNGAEANKEAIAEVIDLRDMYLGRGASPAKALEQAVKRIAPMYAKGEPAAADDTKGAPSPADKRQQQALVRGADASLRQPPAATGGKGGRGGRETPQDVTQMDEKTFASLPKEEKRKLRGDEL